VYYFDVDGAYWLDPNDDGRVPNAWGSEYSVRHVKLLSDVSPMAPPVENHVPVRGGPQLSYVLTLRCTGCGREYRPNRLRYHCADCGNVLDVVYDLGSLARAVDRDMISSRPREILRRWVEFLPIEDPALIDRVTLGEATTPLVEFPNLAGSLGVGHLYVKNDTVLPTGSLEDRSIPLAVLKAMEFGRGTVGIVSSGNAAASLAAYAARAGLRAVVFVSRNASAAKLTQTLLYGARLIMIDGEYSDVEDLFRRAREALGWCDCSAQVNPFRLESKRLYAHEICEQLGWRVPDVVVIPTGGGHGPIAVEKGFRELLDLGWIDRMPRLIAVQPAACAPIAAAFQKDAGEVAPVTPAPTVADAIAVSAPGTGGTRALQAIRATNGAVVAVADEETLKAQRCLASRAGIFAEPGGAVSLAAVGMLARTGGITPKETVVSIVTGHGLKSVPEILPSLRLPPAVPPDWDAVLAASTA